MSFSNRVGTGLAGFDAVIDQLRLGDNVVWQVQTIDEYRQVVEPYVNQALSDGRRLVYLRFGRHPAVMDEKLASRLYRFDPAVGFESMASEIHSIIEKEGREVFYVFDCLTDLLEFWYSDLMIGNFFRLTCPFLYQLDTIAYFALLRNAHTYDTIAGIRETTQLLLDLHTVACQLYIHPLKVWERYSPTMFFPHLIKGPEAVSITASAQAAALFASREWDQAPQDYWEVILTRARAALTGPRPEREWTRDLLISLILGREPRIKELCLKYFDLKDILSIAMREIGTGRIGGKSVGLLLARQILEKDAPELVRDHWEPHDSYYLGSDIYYTYIVQNGWWDLRMKQKTADGYFSAAPELRQKLLGGRFPPSIRERFMRMMEHFGQSPIIVRSSSLLEDNYGNAFAGKYDSVFCANQGNPEDRYQAFEQAVRDVYASTMNEDALAYRMNRGLVDSDEQMAILVQRVSGDHYNNRFFPHVAGVGNSSNLYVWDQALNPEAGLVRIVFGLGTRAVDRVSGDYVRLVALENPQKKPPVAYGQEKKFSQHRADVLDLSNNVLTDVLIETLAAEDLKADSELFFSPDFEAQRRLREAGQSSGRPPVILDFEKMLTETDFPQLAADVLARLSLAYQYPVDVEFTVNFRPDSSYTFNLLQCRPLQTKGLGAAVELPDPRPEDVLLAANGNFMGGNARLAFDYVVFVKVKEYLGLSLQDQYEAARLIGRLNNRLKEFKTLLIGPGRWGTSTPSLGLPVHFSELGHMTAVCEYAYQEGGVTPDLSFGSHFFQDIVESGIFYAAIFGDSESVTFRPRLVLDRPNLLEQSVPGSEALVDVVHLARLEGLTLYADVNTQRLICCRPPGASFGV